MVNNVHPIHHQIIKWIPPAGGWCKLNSDGSCVNGSCAGGGILRDCQGNLIVAFSGVGLGIPVVDYGDVGLELETFLWRSFSSSPMFCIWSSKLGCGHGPLWILLLHMGIFRGWMLFGCTVGVSWFLGEKYWWLEISYGWFAASFF